MTSVSTLSPAITTARPSMITPVTSELRGIDDLAGHRGRRGDVRVGEVHLGLGRAHPARKLRLVVVTARSPAAEHAHVAAEAGAAGRRRDDRAGLDEHVEQALGERLPVDPLRRRDDDHPAVAVDRAPAQDLGRLAQVGHRAVGAVADVDLVDLACRPRR